MVFLFFSFGGFALIYNLLHGQLNRCTKCVSYSDSDKLLECFWYRYCIESMKYEKNSGLWSRELCTISMI